MGDRSPLCLEKKGPLDRSQSQLKKKWYNKTARNTCKYWFTDREKQLQQCDHWKALTQGGLSWHKDTFLISSAKPWTHIILALVPVVIIHILHADPFLNFNLSLKAIVSLIQPSYVQFSYGKDSFLLHLMSFSFIFSFPSALREAHKQPLANCSVFPYPHANILKSSLWS